MKLIVLLGDDDARIVQERRNLLEEHAWGGEDISCEDGGSTLWEAVSTKSLFSPRRVVAVDNIEKLEVSWAEKIRATESDAVIIARSSDTVSPGLKKVLGGIGEVKTFTKPKGRELRQGVSDILSEYGIQAGFDVVQYLTTRLGDDLDRVRSIAKQLQLGQIPRPSLRQIEVLCGNKETTAFSWDVLDAIERKDKKAVIELTEKVEGIGLVIYLQKHYMQLGYILEAGMTSAKEVMETFDIKQGFVAEKTLKKARSLSLDQIYQVLPLLQEWEMDLKSSKDTSVMWVLRCMKVVSV